MKQQILNLKKKLLLAEIGGKLSDEFVQVIDEYGMAEILGKLTDITESQYQQWVGYYEWEDSPDGGGKYAFRDYKDGFESNDYWDMYPFDTAKESFFSYLEKQGILFSNPLGEFPTKQNTGLEYGMDYISKVQRWEEAESKVWCLSNCYLFQILN